MNLRDDNKKDYPVPFERDASGRFYRALRSQLSEADILKTAEEIVERRFQRQATIESSSDTRQFLRTKLIIQEREQFIALFLDTRYRVIGWEVLFQGTVDRCTVFPREVVRRALQHNCSSVVIAHQHPNGDPEPSREDRQITRKLREALALVDIRLLDHLIIGARYDVSFAEQGIL